MMLLRNLNQKAIWHGTPFLGGLKPSFFHSTSPSQAKWKNKWGFDENGNTDPAKKYGKYQKRLLRAEAKRVLKQFQSMKMPPKSSTQGGMPNWNSWRKQNKKAHSDESSWKNVFNGANKGKTRQKTRINHSAQTAERVQKSKRKHKAPHFSWDSDDPDERIFEVFLGGRWFYWSFKDWDEFKWQKTQQFNWTGRTTYSGRDVSDDEASIGLASDRTTLGLAPNGPLKLEDVKQAFRQCALKWHPDRNPGPSKVIAEENFKRCGVAYKALCDALSAT